MPPGRNGAPALQVVVSDQRRGAESFAVDLAAELERRGIAAPLLGLRSAGAGRDDSLPIETLGEQTLSPSTLLALRRAATASAARVAVAHGSRTLPACATALAGTGIPFVYRSIGDPAVWSGNGWRRWWTAAMLRRARKVVALWPGAAATLRTTHRVPSERIRVIPNGVPAARFPMADEAARSQARERLGIPVDARVVASVGSLTREKDVGRSIAAVGRLPGVLLVVAGTGPDRAVLEAGAATDAAGRVLFVGSVPGAAEVLAAADVVVSSSRTEGMPAVLIEAGLTGRPVVATDVGAVAEIVADGDTGVLVRAGDTDGLAAGLERALADDGSMGRAARARCLDRFEIRVVGAMWAELLTDLLAESASA
jgi:glycosyltransferase involved in cell wall biosynthesis